MAEYVCSVCGAPIKAEDGKTTAMCLCCGAQQTLNTKSPWDNKQVVSETVPIAAPGENPKVKELQKQSNENLLFAIICLFVFWPASIYFFYKMYKINEEMKSIK